MGDIAYDLESNAGAHGDAYMNTMQSVISSIPYIITPGNHETQFNFSNVNSRFQMPLYNETQNHYYSWNLNNIHFASINFDLYITNNNDSVFLTEMANWLDNDLQQANLTRNIRPWIVVYSHRPLYCSKKNDEDCETNHIRFAVIDDLLYKYRVDLYMSGHVHTYERMFPVYQDVVYGFYEPNDNVVNHTMMINPEATIHIVQGVAGHFDDANNHKLPKTPKDFSVFISNTYSLVALHSLNNTHLLVENIESQTASVLDHVYIVKDPQYPMSPPRRFDEVLGNGERVMYGVGVVMGIMVVMVGGFLVWRKLTKRSQVAYESLSEQGGVQIA